MFLASRIGGYRIIATPSAVVGRDLNGCTLGGANPGSFAGAAAIDLIFIGSTMAPQNLSLTCASQPTAQSATLTCNETSGTAAAVSRQWSLSCPSGPLLPPPCRPTAPR
ncbi:MAG: hypothetical protein IPK97_10065 [Ahniella sp.]|nr:hypothetical protein [Ahniella sp.]